MEKERPKIESEIGLEKEGALDEREKEVIERAKQEGREIPLRIDVITAREYGLFEGPADNEFETITVLVSPEKAEECLKKGKCGIHYEALEEQEKKLEK